MARIWDKEWLRVSTGYIVCFPSRHTAEKNEGAPAFLDIVHGKRGVCNALARELESGVVRRRAEGPVNFYCTDNSVRLNSVAGKNGSSIGLQQPMNFL
jgi:hypothetical protein